MQLIRIVQLQLINKPQLLEKKEQPLVRYFLFAQMIYCFDNLRLMLEPACVAGLAAIKYKINDKLNNKNTLVILCGSNIDKITWTKLIN